MRRIVAYDVSDDAARARIHDLLLGYGLRVQRSVFECVLDEEQLDSLLQRGLEILDPARDSLLVYAQCERCVEQHRSVESRDDVLGSPFYIV